MSSKVHIRDNSKHAAFSFVLLTTLFYLLFSTSAMSSNATAEATLTTKQIIQRMQQGGLVVYFRHAATDRSNEDRHPVDLERCETQRNLSDLGRKQSEEIGAAFKRLAIPVSEVVSSPFCRCKDTAHIAFGDYDINSNLYFAVALIKQKRDAQTKVLQDMIGDIPKSGNRIIVAHTSNLREATGKWPKPEGAAYFFEPKGNGKFQVLGSIHPDEWKNLNP